MSLISPFAKAGNWYKVNLHTHTTQSDGQATLAEAVHWYASHGYDALAITDHWVATPGQSWDRATPFITLTGIEVDGPGYHMVLLGLAEAPSRDLAKTPERMIEMAHAVGGLAFCAHPYWTGQTSFDVARMGELDGLEVYNSVCEVMDGLGLAKVHWDERLSAGQRLLGVAVDDVHWRHDAQGGGWIWVKAEELSEAALLAAIKRGAFYASGGPEIRTLELVTLDSGEQGLRVTCSPCRTITFYGQASSGRRFSAASGELLQEAVFPLLPSQRYLRVECCDEQGHCAWTQPIYP